MKVFSLVVAFATAIWGGAAFASDIETRQDATVACLTSMNNGGAGAKTWEDCRGMMFEACQTESVGDAAHLACLKTEKADWETHLDADIATLHKNLSMDGTRQLGELMAQWLGYLDKKCKAVADANKLRSAEAAHLGCEVSEYAGLATEFQNCLSGRSTSPYCQLRE